MDLKETASRHLKEISAEAVALSHRIHARPELGFAAWCAEPHGRKTVTPARKGAQSSASHVFNSILI